MFCVGPFTKNPDKEVVHTIVDLSAVYYAWRDVRACNAEMANVRLNYDGLVRAAQDKVLGPNYPKNIWGVTTKMRPGIQEGFLSRLAARDWDLCVRADQVSLHPAPVAAQIAMAAIRHPDKKVLCISPGKQLDEVLSWFPPDQVCLAFFAGRFATEHANTLVLDELIADCLI